MAGKCRLCGENLQPPSIRRNPLWGVTQWESETHCNRCLDPNAPLCPYCQKQISEEATKCTYCGSNLEPIVNPAED